MASGSAPSLASVSGWWPAPACARPHPSAAPTIAAGRRPRCGTPPRRHRRPRPARTGRSHPAAAAAAAPAPRRAAPAARLPVQAWSVPRAGCPASVPVPARWRRPGRRQGRWRASAGRGGSWRWRQKAWEQAGRNGTHRMRTSPGHGIAAIQSSASRQFSHQALGGRGICSHHRFIACTLPCSQSSRCPGGGAPSNIAVSLG